MGLFQSKTIENGEENKQAHFKYSKDNNYAKFIVDLISEKLFTQMN